MKGLIKYILIILLCTIFGAENIKAQNDRQLIRSGNKLYRQQNYPKSEIEYRKALSVNSQNAQALYNLGCALMMQQKDSVAIVQYQQAGKLEKSKIRKAKVFHNIGWICQKHQMYGEAIEAYKESLRNNPNDNETRYNLALCKLQQKNQKKNGGGQNNKNQKDKNKDKNQDKQKQKDKQNKQQNKQQDQQNKQPKDGMRKETAEQLLNAAMQQENATQQRMKKAMQQPPSRKLQHNW
ncbi:MAG: tetratricopeptide repeat protein [Prevotella sp.]